MSEKAADGNLGDGIQATDPQKVRRITSIEERLLAAHDALSAVLDNDALSEVTTEAFDLQQPTLMRPIDTEIKATRATVSWALRITRARLARLGAMEKR